MQVGFYFDQEGCIGCYTCVAACRSEHRLPQSAPDLIKLPAEETGKFPAVRVTQHFMTCFHCAQPACVEACPDSILIKRADDGAVVIDRPEDCSGCRLCVEACPYETLALVSEERPVLYKCDLCLERRGRGLAPACVATCPVAVLEVGPMDELIAKHGEQRTMAFFDERPGLAPSIIFGAP